MEILIDLFETDVYSFIFCVALVFITGIVFGYLSGLKDSRTAVPEYKGPRQRPNTTSTWDRFTKEDKTK